jgi:hypothetical protein
MNEDISTIKRESIHYETKYNLSKSRFLFIIKTLIFILAGSAMIGQGFRMIYQGLVYPNSFYQPGSFDLIFDWFTLSILGILVLWLTFSTFLKKYPNKTNREKNSLDNIMFNHPT